MSSLRLVLALIVMALHLAALSRLGILDPIVPVLAPIRVVQCFFAISGYLMAASYFRCADWRVFASKRIRRIAPAYLAVVLICAATLPATSGRAEYLAAQLSLMNFLYPSLPGVFEANPITAVNGSLWTIKVEVMLYASVPAIAWAVRRWGPEVALGAAYLLSTAYYIATVDHPSLNAQAPAQMAYFSAGMWAFYRKDWLAAHWRIIGPGAIAAYGLAWSGEMALVQPFLLTIGVLWVGLHVLDKWQAPDLSYGLYLSHYPIIQILLAAGLASSPGVLVVGSFFLSFAAAKGLSYVERARLPSLRRAPAHTA